MARKSRAENANGLIGTHLIPAAMDHGMSEVAAASTLATMGVFDIVGTTFLGGDYLPAFVIAGALCLLAAGFVLRLPRAIPRPTITTTEAGAAPGT